MFIYEPQRSFNPKYELFVNADFSKMSCQQLFLPTSHKVVLLKLCKPRLKRGTPQTGAPR